MDSSIPVAEPPSSQVMDVVPPPTSSDDHLAIPPVEEITATDEPKKAVPVTKKAVSHTKKSKPVEKPQGGVTAAIFATVVIVLALSAMATFAYIRTK